MAADRTGNRMGIRGSEDGPLTDPAMIRELNWATLNLAAHYSFLPLSSSPPRTQVFVVPDSDRVCNLRPDEENSERPVAAECEYPRVSETERPEIEISARSELEQDDHPESERRESRRRLRARVSAQPGGGTREFREVRRDLQRRERAHPGRETCHL